MRPNPRRWQPTDIEPFVRSVIAGIPEFADDTLVHAEPFRRGELRLWQSHHLRWEWVRGGRRLGAGLFLRTGPNGRWQESEAALVRSQRGRGIYGEILLRIRQAIGKPIYSDGTMTLHNERAWIRTGAQLVADIDAYVLR